jgi:Asp-tRNA(Asn)/Glu-tRNA(Gln) amidotransferase A subunit family amidase
MFRSREISPVELMEAVIARSEVCEPEFDAFSHTYFEQAIDAARASESRYARGGPCGTRLQLRRIIA